MLTTIKASSRDAITADEVRISYDDLGQGEAALLFLPGWCGSRAVFEPLLERCAQSRRVLALDWRGHGASSSPLEDFGSQALVDDAVAVIEASGVEQVVPVGLAHAGWVALALRERLGAARVPALVLVDWIILDPPPPFLGALQGLQTVDQSQQVWDALRGMWTEGIDQPDLVRYVRDDMGSYGFDMRARAGREIAAAYAAAGNPLRALATLQPAVPTLHLYAQPDDAGYLAAQQAFGAEHPWFQVRKLAARSHFPMFEVPDVIASEIEAFVSQTAAYSPEAVHHQWRAAMNAGRLDDAVALYESDAVLATAPGEFAHGQAAIRSALAGFLALKPRFEMDVRVAASTSDVAVLATRWTMHGTAPDGSPVDMAGTTADVVRRQPDNTWRAAVDAPFGLA
jgi:uncharacterized protein (TIGR02246 family)